MRALSVFVVRAAAPLTVLLLAGCGKDAAPTDALDGAVAQVGDAKLTGRTLEQWMLKAPTAPSPRMAGMVIGAWLDAALLQEARNQGVVLEDSAMVDAAIAPDAARGMILEFWAGRANARPAVTDAQADSLAKLDNVRVLQHFFLGNPVTRDSASFVAVATKAQGILARARAGEDFTKLVKEASQDSATLRNDGYLPAIARDDLPPAIRTIAWELEPGAISKIIPSQLGLHIVRRATAAESRRGLKAWLAPRFSRRADSIFVDSITTAKQVVYAKDAIARLRAMAAEPVVAEAGAPLATWQGGELTPAAARDWMVMLQAAERGELSRASDSSVTTLLREFAQREIILAQAGASHAVAPKARTLLAPQYRAALTEVLTELTNRTAASGPTEVATAFVDSLVSSPTRYRPLPGALGGVLRARFPATVNHEAIASIVKSTQLLWAELHANDSTPPTVPGQTPPPGTAPRP